MNHTLAYPKSDYLMTPSGTPLKMTDSLLHMSLKFRIPLLRQDLSKCAENECESAYEIRTPHIMSLLSKCGKNLAVLYNFNVISITCTGKLNLRSMLLIIALTSIKQETL